MVCAVTLSYTDDSSLQHRWIYVFTGSVFTLLALGGNAAEKQSTANVTDNAVALGAAWGALGGLALFVMLYFAPSAAAWFPGLIPSVDALFKVANWLVSFRLLRWGVGLYTSYLLFGWALALLSAGIFGIGGLAHLLRPQKKIAVSNGSFDRDNKHIKDNALQTGNIGEPAISKKELIMTKAEKAKVAMEYLAEEGFRPSVDSYGDIVFKAEGRSYIISILDSDDAFFQLLSFCFWPIENDEELKRAFRAANAASRETKVAKVFVRGDEKDVMAAVEMFVEPLDTFKKPFPRALSAVRYAIEKFADEMRRELSATEPTPIEGSTAN